MGARFRCTSTVRRQVFEYRPRSCESVQNGTASRQRKWAGLVLARAALETIVEHAATTGTPVDDPFRRA